ncbi:MAG: type II toxin-antitoxin system RelE/ParE family toxin [Firmicutes bacterium]|nr:type II toxin-antitoxin system RelE/ParE family toxin [Bacillota bacterium]
MAYELLYTRRAAKDIVKLDRVVQKRLKKALEKFPNKPLHYAEKLIEPRLGSYRFRAGDYRIIFDIDGRRIIILHVGHRREIYQ